MASAGHGVRSSRTLRVASEFHSSAISSAAEPQVAPDDRRIRTQQLEWEPRPGRAYRGYNAAPAAGRERLPKVLVVHENCGLNDHIRDVARRLACRRLFGGGARFPEPRRRHPACDEDRARTMIGALDMAETVADGAATIAWFASPQGGARKVGCVGSSGWWVGCRIWPNCIAPWTCLFPRLIQSLSVSYSRKRWPVALRW